MMEDPLAPARARAAQHKLELAEEAGPMLTISEVANLLGIDRDAVRNLREAASLLGVRLGGNWRFPSVQFKDNKPQPRLKEVLLAHGKIDEWVMLDSILAADPAFDNRSVLDLLKEEDIPALDQATALIEEQYA